MHLLDFFRVVEQGRDVLNPVSSEKLDALAELLDVQNGGRILDVGSGKGAVLRRWAARWVLEGTELELNPAFVADARERAWAEGVADRLAFVEGPALDFCPDGAGGTTP